MRVALDVSIQGRTEPTGVERAQATLVEALAARKGLELLLCSPVALPPALARCGRALLEPSRALPLALWREAVLPGALRAGGAQLLHSPVAAVPLRAGCPTIATLHELPWSRSGRASGGDRRWTHRARVALAARTCSRIVCVSERTRGDFARSHPEAAARAVVVANAVDPRFTPGPAGPHGADAGTAPVLAVGRLRAKKNLALLLEGFAQAAGCARRHLVLAGPPGDAERELRARASRPDLAGRVDFAGHVSDAALLELYRRAACVVFPSRFEGFGLPVLEALACGTPVIASAQGAPPDVTGDACLLFDALDARALAAALDALLSDRAGAAARRERGLRHAARFSAARAADAMAAVYEQAVGAA